MKNHVPQCKSPVLPPAKHFYTYLIFQFAKRDAIIAVEREVQQRWEKEAVFEYDAPEVKSSLAGIAEPVHTPVNCTL